MAGNRNFDVPYGIDNLGGGRVTRADEGTFASGSISNRSRDEQWTLTQTGNWDRAKVDLNGDGDFTDAGETDDTRVHNVANEITTRDTDTSGGVNYTLTHDAVGNMTDDGMDYKFVYDVWGRLRKILRTSGSALVEEYRYNGLNQRLSWKYDTDADGDCDSNDKTYYFAYDDQWRVVATFRDSDTSPKERFLYHAAGLGGYGGASGGIGGYIDHCILRDKDANTAWDVASDGTLEERMYYCQNWRADVSAILTSAGKMVEWIKYSAYGRPYCLPVGDTDSDGDWDATDSANMTGAYEVRKDADLDGAIKAADVTYANSITGTYQTLGKGVVTSSSVGNRKAYAGYENDGAVVRFAHVRNRVLDSTLGRWTRRDPIGYVDGMGLYGYVENDPVDYIDESGLLSLHGASPCSPYGDGTCPVSGRLPSPRVANPVPFPTRRTNVNCEIWVRSMLTTRGWRPQDPCWQAGFDAAYACCTATYFFSTPSAASCMASANKAIANCITPPPSFGTCFAACASQAAIAAACPMCPALVDWPYLVGVLLGCSALCSPILLAPPPGGQFGFRACVLECSTAFGLSGGIVCSTCAAGYVAGCAIQCGI